MDAAIVRFLTQTIILDSRPVIYDEILLSFHQCYTRLKHEPHLLGYAFTIPGDQACAYSTN